MCRHDNVEIAHRLFVFEARDDVAVVLTRGEQVAVLSDGRDATVLEQRHAIGELNGRWPVRDNEGRTVASMSVTERAEAMTPERRDELRQALFDATAALSRKAFPVGPTLVTRKAS